MHRATKVNSIADKIPAAVSAAGSKGRREGKGPRKRTLRGRGVISESSPPKDRQLGVTTGLADVASSVVTVRGLRKTSVKPAAKTITGADGDASCSHL